MTSTNDSGLPAAMPMRPSRLVAEPATLAACRRDYAAAAPLRGRLDRRIRRAAGIPTAPHAEQPLTAEQVAALLADFPDGEGE
jgi:hypothetical protein